MATLAQMRQVKRAQPFRPFTMQMAEGRYYHVLQPEFLAIPQTPRGREIAFYAESAEAETPEMHRIDLSLILEIIVPAPAASQGPA